MTAILYKPLIDWTADDVLELVEQRVPEGIRLDYKSELALNSKKDRIEAAKDASGMANAQGGLLIYGVLEAKQPDGTRLPVKATPLSDGRSPSTLENLLDSAVSPRLNMAMRSIDTEGGFFLVVRLHQRSGGLHMVDAYGENRYYIRTGESTRLMEAHEVEAAFREAGATGDWVESLVRSLPLVPRINEDRNRALESIHGLSSDDPPAREPGWRPWTSVVSAPLDSRGELLRIRRANRDAFPFDFKNPLVLGDGRYIRQDLFEPDAMGYRASFMNDDWLLHLVRLYRQGVFEWGYRWQARGEDDELEPLPGQVFVQCLNNALLYFAEIYRQIGYFGRLRVWIRVDNADNARLVSKSARQETDEWDIEYVENTSVEELLVFPAQFAHAASDRIWQGFGLASCPYFDVDGNFTE